MSFITALSGNWGVCIYTYCRMLNIFYEVIKSSPGEQTKRFKEMRQHKAKIESQGDRIRAERVKLAQQAQKLLAKGSELSELQQQAWEVINEGKPLSIGELNEVTSKKLSASGSTA